MEKLAYQLWKKDDDSLETFKELLLKNLSKDIGELVSELQINIADADVLPATLFLHILNDDSFKDDLIIFLTSFSFNPN